MDDTRTVLVTGASGFIGRRVSALLAADGWRVTGLDLAPPAAEAVDPAFAAFWRCDLLDERSVVELAHARSFAAVVHLAGLLPGRTTRELFAVNVGGTSTVLAHFARPGSQVLLFSTGLVYGDQRGPFTEQTLCRPGDPYAQSKLAAETLVTAWGRGHQARATVLRPSVVYGAGAPAGMLLVALMEALRRHTPFAMTAGAQVRDFLHVDDAARGVVAALAQRTAGIWNLASGESRTVREAAELGADLAGRRDLLRVGELPYRASEVFDYRLDASAFRQETGWRPQVTLAAGLERLWKEQP